jgi:hypothetical protein
MQRRNDPARDPSEPEVTRRKMTRRTEGTAGFYRTYKPGQVKDLDEAIEFAVHQAEAFGMVQLEVNELQTGVSANGNFHVGLFGRTQKSLDREAREQAAKAKRAARGGPETEEA